MSAKIVLGLLLLKFYNTIMNIFFMHKNNYCIGDIKLDKYQSKAVYCNRNSYLVVAGAGSGKTLTIVGKVKYLIDNGVPPSKILCISFTNESVNSLKSSLMKRNLFVDCKTFHKLSLDILKDKNYYICSSDYLEYVCEEYFNSYIFFDDTYKIVPYEIDKYYKNVKDIIISFIHKVKCNQIDIEIVLKLLRKKIPKDHKVLLIIILKIYTLYEEELNSQKKIDFDDIINASISELDELMYFKYSYLIVDEYQDISYSKYLLIKKIINKFNVKFMAVGDDYQSIYSFSGSDLSYFVNFKRMFNSSVIKLRNTYRCPKDVVEIAKRFVMCNKNQINKRLISRNYINNSINVVYSENEINDLIKIFDSDDNFLVLGRNNKDFLLLKESDLISTDNGKIIYKDKSIRYMTVHSSKGLEEKNVIVLNVVDNYLGFPNKIYDNEIFDYIDKKNEFYPYAEERRLFYVAFTRCKNKVYFFTRKNKESIFLKELIKKYKYKINIFK